MVLQPATRVIIRRPRCSPCTTSRRRGVLPHRDLRRVLAGPPEARRRQKFGRICTKLRKKTRFIRPSYPRAGVSPWLGMPRKVQRNKHTEIYLMDTTCTDVLPCRCRCVSVSPGILGTWQVFRVFTRLLISAFSLKVIETTFSCLCASF